MKKHIIDRQRASLYTRLAQAAALVLVLASIGVGAVGLPFTGRPTVPKDIPLPEVEPINRAASASTSGRGDVDLSGISDRLMLVSNHPKAAAPPAQPTNVSTASTPQAPVSGELRYLGMVTMGPLRMALVSESGRQRFASIGDTLSAGTLEVIEPTFIRFGGDRQTRIEVSARSGEAVTRTIARRPGATGAPNFPAINPATASGIPGAQSGRIPAVASFPTPSGSATPEYVSPENAAQYEQIRDQLKGSGKFSNEEELNETAAKLLEQQMAGEKYKKE